MESSAASLDWPRFLTIAEAEARTAPGKALLRALHDSDAWAPTPAAARLLQHETQEVLPLLDRDALWGPLTGLEDPLDTLDRLERGSILEVVELSRVRAWLYAVDSWVQTPRDELKGEQIRKALPRLGDPMQPLRILDRVLTPEGELSERASPKLAAIHAELRALKRDISSRLEQIVKSLSARGLLQDSISDVRDGRYVVPVKISHQGDVEGIVHEASASRQTVFLEPQEIAPLNNRLRARQNDLIQEIHVVLTETAARLQPFSREISEAVATLAHWDAVQARARHGRRYSGKPVTVSDERVFLLEQTAHPLLWWSLDPRDIIRNDLDFGEPARALLITGPNTGGKTVLLKTLGLAGICARTGFPFPAAGNPIVPFFDAFFADLGDQQSIEAHLSSFSGHVYRFKEILENVGQSSLVLMDELNSATDPEEGAALGRAFLETIMGSGGLVVATTHDPRLKALAVDDKRIVNASMEFDEDSRAPTYFMNFGVPGRSRALETAERLGIPSVVLDLARGYLSKEHLDFEAVLARMQSDASELARARKEAVTIRDEAEKLKKEWLERTGSQVSEMIDKTRQRLRRILEQAQDEVRASVKKAEELAGSGRREIDRARIAISETAALSSSRLESALEEEAPELAQVLKESRPAEPLVNPAAAPAPIAQGTRVRIPKFKNTGTVLEVKGQKAKVSMGTMQMTLSLSDIEALTASEIAALPKERSKISGGTRIGGMDAPPAPASSLDLRGIRFDDAMSTMEQYLDQAFRSGALAEVTIVHGLGSGALREGARKILGKLPYVKGYRDGGLGAGGAGATIVEFDR